MSAAAPDVSFAATADKVVVQRNLRFEHLNVDDGLSQATVMAMTQDEQGFIWIGTQEGLNRYDGHDIKVFAHLPGDPTSLSNDWIFSLLVDNSGQLWVGTDGGGINVYDPETETFTQIRHDPDDLNSLSSDRVRVVYQDSTGVYWVGTTGGGLNRVDLKNGLTKRLRFDPDDPGSLPNDTVVAIAEDRRGALWVGTDGGGLARLDRATMSFVRYRSDDSEFSLSDDRVAVIYEDRDGWLWIGTGEGGLNRFDTTTGRFERYQHDPDDPASLANNRVRDILQDRDGTLWVATEDGLDEWRPRDRAFVHYQADEVDPTTLSDSRLTRLFQGSEGVLWVGSYSGVNKWNYFSDAFIHYRAKDGFLGQDVVTSIAEASDGGLWVGTYGGGLSHIDLKAGTATTYRNVPGQTDSLSDNRVMTVLVDDRDVVWAGTRNDGLNRFDPRTGSVTRYGRPELSSNSVARLASDPDGTLWIGTFGGGLNRLAPDGTVTWYRHDPADPTSIGGNRVLAVYRDSGGTLWVGTEAGGLNRFDPDTGTFERILHEPDNPHSLSANAAWEILESSDGSLWIATMSDGLNRWGAAERNAGIARFERWTKSQGLRSNAIYGLLEDDTGGLWLSSNRGITRLDPQSGDVRHFDRKNGLISDDFTWCAREGRRSGQMLFGGTKGLVSFFPGQLRRNQNKPPIVLSGHSPLERLAVTYSGLEPPDPIVLEHTDNYVAFEFAALDYISPDKNDYRYMLEGFDSQWLDPGDMRRVTYANLSPGDYLFRVKASNSDGVWNEKGAVLPVRIEPSPWRSSLAYTVYLSLGLALLAVGVRYQAARFAWEAKQRKELEHQVAQRTSELGERNRQLEELNVELRKASVTDSLTRLYNRRYLNEFVHSHLAAVDREIRDKQASRDTDYSRYQQSVMFFMMIDLDGFKEINDTHGHNAGDRALLQVRDILLDCIRKSDTVIRWGGDEFLIVGHTVGLSGIANFAERVRLALMEHSYDLGFGHSARLSASIGAVPYPFAPLRPQLLSFEQSLSVADFAAYVVKTNGRNGWAILYGGPDLEEADTKNVPANAERLVEEGKLTFYTSIEQKLVLDSGKQHVA